MSPGLTHHLNISVENHVALQMRLPLPLRGPGFDRTTSRARQMGQGLKLDMKSTRADTWQEKSSQKAAGLMAQFPPMSV